MTDAAYETRLAADRLTQLSEENERLERRLSGLHEANGKTVDTANEQFHRANRYRSALQWIAEHGDDDARQRARAALSAMDTPKGGGDA